MARKKRGYSKYNKTVKPPVEIVETLVEKETSEEEEARELFVPKEIKKPVPPLGRLMREGDTGPYCPICGSSLKLKWHRLSRTNKCINFKCDNYHDSGRSGGCC